jgi:all-beta uncharacterized protein
LMRLSLRCACVCLTLMFAATLAAVRPASAAGTVVDARRLTFTVSPDDQAVDQVGTPLVTRYELQVFLAGSDTLVESVNLGKPTPDRGGTVTLQLVPLLYVPLTPNVSYDAVVRASGPGGDADSARSNTFIFTPPPCDPWISPSSLDVEFPGGPGATNVHAGATCRWTAVSNDPWLTITAGQAGMGDGTVTFLVAPNPNRPNRNGSLTVAGSTFRVNQDGVKNQCDGGRGKDDDHGKDDKHGKDGKDGKDRDDCRDRNDLDKDRR